MINTINKLYVSLNLLLQFLIYYILILHLTHYYNKEFNYLYPLLIIPILLVAYIARRLSKNIVTLILFHIPLFILPWIFSSNSGYSIIFTIFIIAILGFSLSYWCNSKTKEILAKPKLGVITIFILLLLSVTKSGSFSYNLTFYMGVFYIILFYILKYLSGLKSYIYYNSYLEEFPIHKVIKLNNSFIFSYISLGIIGTVLIKIFRIDQLLINIFGPFLKYLYGLFASLIDYIVKMINSEIPAGEVLPELSEKASKVTNNMDSTLLKIIITLISIGLLIMIIIIIVGGIYSLLKSNFTKYQCSNDEVTFIDDLPTTSFFKRFIRRELKYDNSANGLIRKYYYKKISQYKKKNKELKDSLTHLEINHEVNVCYGDNISTLTKIYEKARYSSQECTKDDLNKLKNK